LELSNRMSITYGSDHLGHAILIDGDPKLNVLSQSQDWILDESAGTLNDHRRCWRIPSGKIMERTTNQCPMEFFEFLEQQLEGISTLELHPSLVDGFESEAERSFPEISEEAKNQFKSFVNLIKTTYGINEEEERAKVMMPVVDDIGPNLLVLIDQKPAILPEIPKTYLAPKDWAIAIWRINNHMIGPLLMDEVADEKKIQFLGLSMPFGELSERQKGIYYFHMARFILFFESWTRNPNTPHLLEFIRLFKKGLRYFDE
jgi:hypothetical protein